MPLSSYGATACCGGDPCAPCQPAGSFVLAPIVATSGGSGLATARWQPEEGPFGTVVVQGLYYNLSGLPYGQIAGNELLSGVQLHKRPPGEALGDTFAIAESVTPINPVDPSAGPFDGSFTIRHMVLSREDLAAFRCGYVVLVISTEVLAPAGEVAGVLCLSECEPLRRCAPPCPKRPCGCKCYGKCSGGGAYRKFDGCACPPCQSCSGGR